jgi:FKBP-type peptidyl-prolyl cis-trans isomerase
MQKFRFHRLLVAFSGVLLTVATAACAADKPAAPKPAPAATAPTAARTTASGLQIQDTLEGKGEAAMAGQNAKVHYTGWLWENGKRGAKFDSSVDRGQPLTFPLGAGRVIKGWDEGVQGMKVGGKRILTIPPELGYGARGGGTLIPPNATLQFEVEYLGKE